MPTQTEHYDLAIVGAGAGGLTVAAVASQLGRKVCLLEKGEMGGDCLNHGCVPSKALLAAAKRGANFQHAMAHVHSTVKAISHHDSQARFEGLGCTVVREAGTFTDAKTLKTSSGRHITAKRFIVATGSRPFVPPIAGLHSVNYLTNERIFSLSEQPKSLIVLGAGPIGLEMAQAFHLLGTKVTVLEAAGHFLPHDEPELAAELRQQLAAQGIEILTQTTATQVEKGEDANTVVVHAETHKGGKPNALKLMGTHLLVATGHTPNTDAIGADAAGMQRTERGHIITNAQQRTANKRIYAVGDCAGPYAFTHMAGKQAGTVIQRLLFGQLFAKTPYHAVPWVTYTTPELAHVGETEASAVQKYGKNAVQTVLLKGSQVDRFMAEAVPVVSAQNGTFKGALNETMQKNACLKVVLGKKGRLLGASLLAERAGEVLSPFYVLVGQKQALKALSSTLFPYPTHAEIGAKASSHFYGPVLYSAGVKRLSAWLWRLLG